MSPNHHKSKPKGRQLTCYFRVAVTRATRTDTYLGGLALIQRLNMFLILLTFPQRNIVEQRQKNTITVPRERCGELEREREKDMHPHSS